MEKIMSAGTEGRQQDSNYQNYAKCLSTCHVQHWPLATGGLYWVSWDNKSEVVVVACLFSMDAADC